MKRKTLIVLVALLVVSLQGCFTTALWGGEMKERTNRDTGRVEQKPSFNLVDAVTDPPGLGVVAVRVLLTPFTLVLDCVTAPVQAVLYGWEDDDC